MDVVWFLFKITFAIHLYLYLYFYLFPAQAGDSLTTISGSVDSIKNMSNHINVLTEQQKFICSDIHARIMKIQNMTDETSQGAHATATPSEMLAANSHKLQDLVNRFSNCVKSQQN